MSEKSTIYMHAAEDHPLRMVIGYKLPDILEIQEPVRTLVFDALGLDKNYDYKSDSCALEAPLDSCSMIKPINVGKDTDKFTLTVCSDNINGRIWICVDLGYEFAHSGEDKELYTKHGAIDPEKVVQIIHELDNFAKGTVLEEYGKPLLAALWTR